MSEAPVPIGLVPIILLIKSDNITPSTIDSVLSLKDNFCVPDLPVLEYVQVILFQSIN